MKGRGIAILFFLAFGALVTTAVALVCFLTMQVDFWNVYELRDTPPWMMATGRRVSGNATEEIGRAFGVEHRTYTGEVVWMAPGATREFLGVGEYIGDFVRVGWPFRAVGGGWCMGQDGRVTYVTAIDVEVGGFLNETWTVDFIPVGVIWSGVAMNTTFYALILWAVVRGPSRLRRYIRKRRHLCRNCGYPTGTSSVCSECGTQL